MWEVRFKLIRFYLEPNDEGQVESRSLLLPAMKGGLLISSKKELVLAKEHKAETVF